MPVRIITDSGSDYYDGDSDLLTVLPLTIAFGDTVYRADVDLTREGFYEKLVEGDEFPTTGQVNPYQFQEAVAAAVAAGEDAVAVVISEKLSGTYRSAVAGTEAALEEAGAAAVGRRVRVVDSGNVTVGEHVLVEHALHMADAGASADEIADELERLRDRVCTIGLLDTLEYLKRGGRIPPAAATVGQLLSIKPVIAIADGEVQILGRERSSSLVRPAVPRTAATSSTRRSRRAAASISRCRYSWATADSPTPCCRSTSATRMRCGPGIPETRCRPCRSARPSARTWARTPSPSRSSRRTAERSLRISLETALRLR